MKDKLKKVCGTDEDDEQFPWIIVDITSYLRQDNQIEWLTTKLIVGMKELFRR